MVPQEGKGHVVKVELSIIQPLLKKKLGKLVPDGFHSTIHQSVLLQEFTEFKLFCCYSISYMPADEDGRFNAPQQWQYSQGYSQYGVSRRRIGGAVIDTSNLRSLDERRDFCLPVSLLLRNARPVGHHVS